MTMNFEEIMAAILLLIAVLCYFFLILPTQWLKVDRIQYPCGLGVRVLQISDLHVEKLRVSHTRLERLIREENPDYIFLTGDYTEKPRYLDRVERYAKAISSAGIPVFAVLGNHDHRLRPGKLKRLIQIFNKEGFHVLINQSFVGPNFQIVGIDDLSSKKSKIGKSFVNIDPKKPTIVITHDPNTVLHIKHRYTYLVSGHFHGMQFKVPFLYRFIKKGRLAAEGIIKGLHTGSHGTYYISQGIGQAGLNARFLIRSEVTLHEL
ncbi:metallophosphoesterase [Cohnella sp.]|uniref:metallophosphoesterase n=1 Tax=Cohnella sp. TaxID=1883426 RepID=UPI003567EFF0